MKRIIVFITTILLFICMGLCGYFFYKYNSYGKISKVKVEINDIKKKTALMDKEISDKNKEIENIKNNNNEKVRMLELWQRSLKQVKQDS